jgi:hypothetical protein
MWEGEGGYCKAWGRRLRAQDGRMRGRQRAVHPTDTEDSSRESGKVCIGQGEEGDGRRERD